MNQPSLDDHPHHKIHAVTGGILHFFSRKERAKRKLAHQQAQACHAVEVPPAYKADPFEVPRTAHHRPLSSFAPDYSRQYQSNQQYQQQRQQHNRYSYEQPPPYQTPPTYDPSRYQPIRPISATRAELQTYAHPYNAMGHSSHLSAVHYHNVRSSMYPSSLVTPPRQVGPSHIRRQSALPYSAGASVAAQRPSIQADGRERSTSEPMPQATAQTARGPRRPKPKLAKLITNFG